MFYPPMYSQPFNQLYSQQFTPPFLQPYPQPFQRRYFQTPGSTYLRAFPESPDVSADYQVNSLSSQENKDRIDHKVEQ
ncbi:putative chromosome segregation protein [Erysiphe neolycopersici]|uniref:Putative chromosome segregation protein n=1 Tax=Erysiphe neolycopersici TaxID=212602 RepID=A0A420H7H7_9PEZI|nr:putative chromosome segregation protein [Erysiphe neolycopersici]